MIRDAFSPGGTYFGKQIPDNNPNKWKKVWQYEVRPSATAGEAAELRQANRKSYRSALSMRPPATQTNCAFTF